MIDGNLNEFHATTKTYGGKTKTVYRRGDTGPGVVLMHEIPGVTPKVLGLGKRLADAGFRVALPSFFGQDGRPVDLVYVAREFLAMCISKEFKIFAGNGSSPIINWVRALCIDLADETGGPVGAIGLCLTGGFALSLTVGTNGVVRAPVMGEPSLPIPFPFVSRFGDVHLTPEEQSEIRGAASPPVMGLRFTGDIVCTGARFTTYRALLGSRFANNVEEIHSPDRALNIPSNAHSVLTQHHSDRPQDHPTERAFQHVLEFLRTNLR